MAGVTAEVTPSWVASPAHEARHEVVPVGTVAVTTTSPVASVTPEAASTRVGEPLQPHDGPTDGNTR